MGTAALGDIFAENIARFKQTDQSVGTAGREAAISLTVRPVVKSWEDLINTLDSYGALDEAGLYRRLILITVRDLYDQGYGSELATTAELAKQLATREKPSHYFARSVSKKAGKWHTVTLEMVRKTWEVRKNAQLVIEKLKLQEKATGHVLALAWKFKGSILRFLGQATEQGYGIKNPAGYFFGIIKHVQEAKAAP